jgi:long-chain acyl-CoA synthetase
MTPSLLTAVLDHVRQTPDASCLLWQQTQWSYGDLGRAIASVAVRLKQLQLQPGDRVALLIRNCPQYVALYYGVLAAGAAVVPLNAQERASVLARQIEHSDCSVLAGDPRHPEWRHLQTALASSRVTLLPIAVADDATSVDAFCDGVSAENFAPVPVDAQALAMLIYTSGTTGRPKAVMLSHGNLWANTQAIIGYLSLTAADRGACVLPFHFSYGNSVLNTHLVAGASLLIEDNLAFPQVTMQRIADQGCTGFAGVPSTFTLLLGRTRLPEFNLSKLRYLTQAGGPMPKPITTRLREVLPNAQLFVMYGQTEATARITYLPPEKLEAKLGSVGIPVAETEITIRDLSDVPVAVGETGEICVRGPGIMLGYWKDAEASYQALRGGWLRTGDLGHVDNDGYVYIDGRAVEMIKVGAFRVSPQEVEEAITSLQGVQEVAVTSQPDEVLGQAVKAVIVQVAGASLDERAVKAHCRQHLASYKIPKSVEFAATLPRTASGKVQRFKLA